MEIRQSNIIDNHSDVLNRRGYCKIRWLRAGQDNCKFKEEREVIFSERSKNPKQKCKCSKWSVKQRILA